MKREDLEALGQDLYPDVAAMCAERRELFRVAAVRALEVGSVPAESLPWYRWVAGFATLARPLTTVQCEP